LQREVQLYEGYTEQEYALHDGIDYIPRQAYDTRLNRGFIAMHPSSITPKVVPLDTQGPLWADFETPGLISSDFFRQHTLVHDPLPDEEIEIKTAAISLNWKDIGVAAGKIDMNYYSSEFAGTVTKCSSGVTPFKPGDQVYAHLDEV
jgi:hypothetical protein